jgi:malate dehydrogenase (oxaloacetate-decarboxylating)(NADP+)
VLENLRRKDNDIERYIFLQALLRRNQRLFYRTVIDNFEEILPLIYTPTVGQACREFAHIFRETQGLYITAKDRGRVLDILRNWPHRDVRAIVVTDGERILGLGDLGASGMGIPIGKLALYTACAGIPPEQTLPVTLDVGTNNRTLLADPLYLGLNRARVGGDAYFGLVEEFVVGVQELFPGALIQFEDFLTPNAYALLDRYRDRVLCFNDDIQGTASVALAGIRASTRVSGLKFEELKLLFLGAGSAGTGIADLMIEAFVSEGLSRAEAEDRVWLVDVNGLIVRDRSDLLDHHRRHAHDHAPMGFLEAIRDIRPNVLVGATGQGGAFTREVVELMSDITPRPTILALSNPTSQSECTAEQAYAWSGGRAIFASGSPFPPVAVGGRELRPAQANNVYVFPGIGLAAVACGARRVTDHMFLTAAKTLASLVDDHDLNRGAVYPPLVEIRKISLAIATSVVEEAQALGLADDPIDGDVAEALADVMYDPTY